MMKQKHEMNELVERVVEQAGALRMVKPDGTVNLTEIHEVYPVLRPVYMGQLLRGRKPTEALGREYLAAIANFLGVSYLQAAIWAGVIRREDFTVEAEWKERCCDLWHEMSSHPEMGGLIPPRDEWERASLPMQRLVVLLFGQVTGNPLLPPVYLGE